MSHNELFDMVGVPRGLAIMILEEFESMLADKGIKIPDDDIDGEKTEACLYGKTYYTLAEWITNLLSQHIEEDTIDKLYHDASEDELRKMGAFDNLNDEEE